MDIVAADIDNIHRAITGYLKDGGDINHIIKATMYDKETYNPIAISIDNKAVITVFDNIYPDKLYNLNLYINLSELNQYTIRKNTEHIGSIEKY